MYITLSRILENAGKTDTCLKFVNISCSPDLNKGITRAIFNRFGTIPEVMDKLIMLVIGKIILSIESLLSS